MTLYLYRTTAEKLDGHTAKISEAGDTVVSSHFIGGRDWALICRSGEPTVADMTREQLVDAIAEGVAAGHTRHARGGARPTAADR